MSWPDEKSSSRYERLLLGYLRHRHSDLMQAARGPHEAGGRPKADRALREADRAQPGLAKALHEAAWVQREVASCC